MPTAPGFADVSLKLNLAGLSRPAFITFGVDPTDTDPTLIGTAIWTASSGATSLMGCLDNNVTLTEIRVSAGTDGGEDLVGIYAPNGPGQASQASLPANCALLVHKTTTRGGRRGRGRLFIPWAAIETDVDEAGVVGSTTVTSMQTKMSAWRTALATNQVPMVVLHDPSRPDIKGSPTTPGAPNLVTALVVDRLISTQRRRLGRHG